MLHFRLRLPRLGLPDKNRVILIVSLGLCISFIGILVFLKFGHKAAAGWYDDNYLYRQAFTFTHNAIITSDRAVTFTLNTSTLISGGVMQSDCDDVRFTDMNGKPLKFQMTGSCNSTTTTFEVVFPSVTATGNAAYVYYGNPSASSGSQSVSGITALTPATSGDPAISNRTAEEAGPAPVGAWNFDDATGTTAQDSSSTNYDGTLTNGPTWKPKSECVSGSCLSFDGTDDYVDAGTGTATDLGTADVTISAWIRAQDPVQNYGNIMINGGTTSTDQGFFWSVNGTTGVLEVSVSNGSSYVVNAFAGTTDLRDNKWHYVTWVWDRDVGNKFYIDGKLEKSDSSTNASTITSGQNLTIGGRSGAFSPFKGLIDEVRMYKYVRSATQIQEDYIARSSVHGASTQFGNADEGRKLMDGLVGWWKLDDTASPANDSSGNTKSASWNGNTTSTSGIFGKGTTFDGTGDYLSAVTTPLLSNSSNTAITLSTWFKTNASSTGPLLAIGDTSVLDGSNAGTLTVGWRSGTGNLAVSAHDGISTHYYASASSTYRDNLWHMVTVVIDSTSMKLYVDGTFISENTNIRTDQIELNANRYLWIAARSKNSVSDIDDVQSFNGALDDVRTYGRSFSPPEVRMLYNYAPPPVGYWKLDENAGGDGTTINDSSTYGNNGTLTSPAGGTVFGSTPTFQQVVSGTALSAPVSVSTTSITGVTNNLYIAAIQGKGGDAVISSVTGLGLTWNYVDASNPVQCGRGNASDLAVYYAIGTPSGNGAVTANFSNPPSDQATIVVTRYSGVDTSSPIGAVTSANIIGVQDTTCGTVTDDAAPTVNLTTTSTNSLVYGAIGKRSRSSTPGTGYTERADVSSSTDAASAAGVAVEDKSQASPATVTVDATLSSSSSWSIYAVEIKSASTTTGAGSNWVPGKYGSALQFDGSSGVVRATETTTTDLGALTDNYTVSAWFKTSKNYSNEGFIVAKNSFASAAYPFTLFIDPTEIICFEVSDGTHTITPCSTATYNDNKWHYATGIRNTLTDTIELYIDGVKIATSTDTTTTSAANNDNVSIGNGATSYTSRGFAGGIDDVRIYNYARAPGQIVADMNAGHPLGGSPVGSQAAYYKFDEGYGTTAYDSSLFLNNATLGSGASAPTWSSSGKFGKTLSFDGTNDYLSFSRGSNIQNIASQGTISTWVYYDTLDSTLRTDVDIASTGVNGLILYSNGGSNKPVLQYGNGSTTTQVAATSTFATGTWYHIVATWDSGGGKIYINGKLEASSTVAPSITISSGTAYIGSNQTTQRFHAGRIDEIKIYGAALNAEQVLVDYNRGKAIVLGSTSTASDGVTADNSAARRYCSPGDTTSCSAPYSEWNFDENSGTTANDTSGNGRSGTLTSGPLWTPGIVGSALSFDGTNDYVNVSNATAYDFGTSTAFTIGAWVKMSSSGANDRIIVEGNDVGSPFFSFRYTGAANALNAYIGMSGAWCDIYGATNIQDNAWHYVTAVFNRNNSCTTNDIVMYVDGKKEIETINISSGSASANINVGGVTISRDTKSFQGKIDQVRIYNYARTSAQIAWDYNRGTPVAQYKFDECQGTTAYNSVRIGNIAAGMDGTLTIASGGTNTSAGTCTGAATDAWKNGATGKINSSINLDGSNDYVSIADNSALEFTATQDFAITTWVKIPASQAVAGNGEGSIIDKGNSTNMPYRIRYVAADGTFYAARDDAIGHQPSCGSTTSIGDNTWHHIVFTKVSSTLYCYLDGKLVDAEPDTTTGTTTNANSIYIGQRGDGLRFLTGSIDDVRIYNYGLSATQVRDVYNNGTVSFK